MFFVIGMDTQVYRNFFFYFFILFTMIASMKYKAFCFCCCIGFYTYACDALVVNGPAELSAVSDGADIIINNGGIYNLSDLERFNSIQVDFEIGGGGTVPLLTLVADAGFDGTFNNSLVIDEGVARLQLQNDFLNLVDYGVQEVVYFSDLHMNNGRINISDENNSRTYVYVWDHCVQGDMTVWCVKRIGSQEYDELQNNIRHQEVVARESVQMNPEMLLRPMMAIHQHELLGYYRFADEFSVSLNPEYYVAKRFHNYGVNFDAGTKIGARLSVGARAYVSKSEFKNSVSDFGAVIYGGNLRLNYDLTDVLFVRGVGGVSVSDVNCDGVMNGESTVNNPKAIGVYGGIDAGAKFNFESGLFVSPFIGYGMLSEKVVDVRESDSFVHFGNDIGFKYFMDGVSYKYLLRTGVDSHGSFDAEIGIGVWAVSDKIGGDLAFGIVNTDFGWSGRASVNIRVAF